MASLSAIVIPDDEESGLEQGRSQPPRASRPDYSYQDWEDTMHDAAASDDATDVATPPARKRKRQQTEDSDDYVMRANALRNPKSIKSIFV